MQDSNEKSFALYDAVGGMVRDELSSGSELGDDSSATWTVPLPNCLKTQRNSKKRRRSRRPLRSGSYRRRLDKSNDSVRVYLREMGMVPLLTREGEIELAKRIERGQKAVRKALSRSRLVVRTVD